MVKKRREGCANFGRLYIAERGIDQHGMISMRQTVSTMPFMHLTLRALHLIRWRFLISIRANRNQLERFTTVGTANFHPQAIRLLPRKSSRQSGRKSIEQQGKASYPGNQLTE